MARADPVALLESSRVPDVSHGRECLVWHVVRKFEER